jgi:hypothetical protein
MTNYLSVILKPSAMNWLMNLRPNTIGSWDDLKRMFIKIYVATYARLGTKHGLERIYQKTGEPLHGYVRHFSEMRNFIPNISEAEVISAFVQGLYHHQELCSKFNQKPSRTIGEMLQTANQYDDAEEADQRHKEDVAQVPCPNRPARRNDDCYKERSNDHRDCRYDDRNCRFDDG